MKKIILAASALLLIAAGCNFQNSRQQVQESDQNQGQQPQADYVTGTGDVKTYVSPTLGIKFDFVSTGRAGIEPQNIIRKDNEISFHDPNLAQSTDKTLTVWNKDPKQSLSDVITKKFLSSYDPAKCWAEEMQGNGSEKTYTDASIRYPLPDDPSLPWFDNAGSCGPYGATNGVAHFRMENSSPNFFYFMSAGQYPWPDGNAAGTKTVFETVRGINEP